MGQSTKWGFHAPSHYDSRRAMDEFWKVADAVDEHHRFKEIPVLSTALEHMDFLES